MTAVVTLSAVPPPGLAAELARFERQFTYPLGPARRFRIDHGADYSRFFRAMGGASFVATRGGRVVGTLGAAVRGLTCPDGSRRVAVYLGDLKSAPDVRGGRVLPRLAAAARAWAGGRVDAAFSVVMGGTTVTPERYTGRLDIPTFREAGTIAVLRFDTAAAVAPEPAWVVPSAAARDAFTTLARGRYHCDAGDAAERSETEPAGLLAPDGSACGVVEDTARAKRLIVDDGTELRSAHLSGFAYATPEAGAALVRAALGVAAGRGFPALFLAVPATDAPALVQCLPGVPVTVAPAAVHAAELPPGDWIVNTAEI